MESDILVMMFHVSFMSFHVCLQ